MDVNPYDDPPPYGHTEPMPAYQPPPPPRRVRKGWIIGGVAMAAVCSGLLLAGLLSGTSNASKQTADKDAAPSAAAGGAGFAPANSPSPHAVGAATATATSASTPKPPATHKPTPKPSSKPKPKPTTKPFALCGAPANPWHFTDCSGGSAIHQSDLPSGVCGVFDCIPNFPNGKGYMDECKDGTYSMSGGIRGACSHHGGEMRQVHRV